MIFLAIKQIVSFQIVAITFYEALLQVNSCFDIPSKTKNNFYF